MSGTGYTVPLGAQQGRVEAARFPRHSPQRIGKGPAKVLRVGHDASMDLGIVKGRSRRVMYLWALRMRQRIALPV